ncbi:hypothetical protein LCM23_13290 [Cytobacillus kochii]|uniref:hypothetical protein n=1 Tax=Cytobacillus kochii TaxID=859143 RepID=UPI001CD356D1|nr:hypothetical protein [Cytobacillus kochii]MCA1027070.1 hypothetical protein [Cytobacillus kochii]
MDDIKYFKARYEMEIELWNQAMDMLNNNSQDSLEYKEGMDIARTIESYSNLIHNKMMMEYGETYYKFATGGETNERD